MERLLQWLDELVAEGALSEGIAVQSAARAGIPTWMEALDVIGHDDFIARIQQADVVISHAGPGSLSAIRLSGKVPIVVPRSQRHGEHVDDHQEIYAQRLRTLSGYLVAESKAELEHQIVRARAVTAPLLRRDVSLAVSALESLIGHL
jgi:UDP-N-acetylglucosamine transferase subunit ALG13